LSARLTAALAITVVTTYVPVAASEFLDSSIVIGGLIAIEGVLALWLPLVVGSWSDRLRTSIGGRLPFLVAATPIACVSLAVSGLVQTLPLMALTVTVFFVAYFIAYEPYRALYPDLIDDAIAARAQSTQAIWRGTGTGIALIGGGLLVAWGTEAPFAGAALLFAVAMGSFVALGRLQPETAEATHADPGQDPRDRREWHPQRLGDLRAGEPEPA
jgi:Na+/melibiose symporter-like transporter